MFSNAVDTSISGGTFAIAGRDLHLHHDNAYQGKAPELLQAKVASGAFHNSSERYDPPKCHEGTRKAIIKDILDWIQDFDKQEFFPWLYGPAGAGKSAIAQTIAEICSRLGLLAAKTCEFIYATINTDPLIFTRSLKAQLEDLILQPLLQVFFHQPNTRSRFIIIDGLDECSQPSTQRYILTTLSSSIQRHRIPLSFLIASRPEMEIREAFSQQVINARTRRLVLDDKYKPDADVKIFLTSKFDKIKELHPLKSFLPASWPSVSDMKYLIQRSSGQFVYASTVMKFIESPRHRPMERLNIVLGLTSPGKHIPFAELDAFYLHIFASVEDIEAVKEVLSFLLFFDYPKVQKRTEFVEKFLSYQTGDLQIILADLHSVISVPSPQHFFAELQLFHTSLHDFLVDRSRSGNFFIDVPNAHARLAKYCLDHMNRPSSLHGLQSFLRHCPNAHPSMELVQTINEFYFKGDSLFNSPIDDEEFVYLPAFFDWLRNQIDDNGDLYGRYLALYDLHLRGQLSYDPLVDRFYLLLTGLFLQEPSSGLWKIVNYQSISDGGLTFEQIDSNRLRLLRLPNLRGSSYYSMLKAFFADSTRSEEYHIEISNYIDLAKKCVSYLGRGDSKNDDDPEAPMSDILLGSKLYRRDDITPEGFRKKMGHTALVIIRDILLRFPGQHELAICLAHNAELKNVLKSKEIALARAYMKACGVDASTWESLPGSLPESLAENLWQVLHEDFAGLLFAYRFLIAGGL